jgi:hypothetical protein
VRIRLATAAAVGGLALLALPGHAATAKPQITDRAGDANGVNDQALFLSVPSLGAATPADISAADITAVTFATTYKTKRVDGRRVRVPNGFTVTMRLAAAPSMGNIIYRVSADTGQCPTSVFFEYTTGGDSTVRCPAADVTDEDTEYPGRATVKGTTITWKLGTSALPVGTKLTALNAQTRQVTSTPVVFVTAPQYDYASSTKTFAVGK